MEINYKKLNPNAFHLLRYLQDETIRFIILYGGSSSGKSFSVAQSVLLMTLHDGENTCVFRKVGSSIRTSIYEDFKVASKALGIYNMFRFKIGCIECVSNGARIDFKGLDESEKIKGLSNYKRVLLEELSEFDKTDLKQIRKRLRGKRGQQIICTFNPISETHWIKTDIFDHEQWHEIGTDVELGGKVLPSYLTEVKSIRINSAKNILNPRTKEIDTHAPDMVVIQSTYLNNFWVVGSPDGTYGYYDEQCIADFEKDRLTDPDYYNIYALGEWGVLRTGSEFFGSFNIGKHSSEVSYNPDLPIHISVDNNVLPYISVTYWQADLSVGKHIRQIAETCAKIPDNTVRKAARLVAVKLRSYSYAGKVYLHGDASTRASNTIDEQKRSWLDLFISSLQGEGIEVVDCVGNKNPNVALTGEFVNAIFESQIPGITITIGSECKTSIQDYLGVQKNVNGAMLKTKVKDKVTMQSYEDKGHLSDTFRYLTVDILNAEYIEFSNRRKRNLYARDGYVSFFNHDTDCLYSDNVLYVMPNIGGKLLAVVGRRCGNKWHITNVAFMESSAERVRQIVNAYEYRPCVFECGDAYFPTIRELRYGGREIKAMREVSDVDARISATSDYVGTHLLFDPVMIDTDEEYARFMSSLLDYNKDSQDKEASTILSGFVQFVAKNFPDKI